MNTWSLVWIGLAGAVALAILLVLGTVWSVQRFAIYNFSQERTTPEQMGLERVRAISFVSGDGETVGAWVAPPLDDRPVLITFFGNGASIGPSAKRLQPLIDEGWGFAMLEYRGSGGAPGRSNEERMGLDARALYDQLDTLLGEAIPADRRVIHGFSLGVGVAVPLAVDRPSRALIVEAGFSRMCGYFTYRFRGLPFCRLMWAERFETGTAITKVTVPVLIVHGEQDPALPVRASRRLYDAAREPKALKIYPGGHHVDLPEHGFLADLKTFVEERHAAR